MTSEISAELGVAEEHDEAQPIQPHRGRPQGKRKFEPKKKQAEWRTIFDFDLIGAAKAKLTCEFDLGDKRLSGIPLQVDRFMIKVKLDSGTESWIGKHWIMRCDILRPSRVENSNGEDTSSYEVREEGGE